MTRVSAWGVSAAGSDVGPLEITRREPGPHDVVIDIDFCGVCHSDIHTARGEWGEPMYPVVTGHEIIGHVSAVGVEVSRFRIGDIAGVGVIVDSCRECDACTSGFENYCMRQNVGTYNSRELGTGATTYGGYSTSIVTDERFTFSIPTNLDPAAAAPLLCAGITLWSPLRHWQAGPGKRIAVMGMGGLGHMGIKLARALGAHVTVLSHSSSKREDALRLGAEEFVITSDAASLKQLRGSFDLILNTVSADLDINEYLKLLRWNGTLVVLGLPGKPLVVHAGSLMDKRRTLSASGIGGRRETHEILDFCGQHNIVSDVEIITPAGINAAWARVVASDGKDRFVIEIKA